MLEQTSNNIDDVLRKETGCASELDDADQTSWMLFLKDLDDLEDERGIEPELGGKWYPYLLNPRAALGAGKLALLAELKLPPPEGIRGRTGVAIASRTESPFAEIG